MNDDDLTALTDDALDRELELTEHVLSSGLTDLLTIPDRLNERTNDEVRSALLDRSTVAAAADLLSVGWHTVRLIFSNEPPEGSPR